MDKPEKPIGLINTLRAYDSKLYIPEIRDNTAITQTEPVIIKGYNKSERKLIGDITIQEHKEK